jgi:hypothetical protein
LELGTAGTKDWGRGIRRKNEIKMMLLRNKGRYGVISM